MSNTSQNIVDELASIIKLLADVWPNDRENVAIAGAKFEGIIESFDQNYGQIQKLSTLSWEGIKYLYEKDEYFITVKATTMQAINLFREYILSDGDVKVEDFEKAFDELQNSLAGGGESADELITEQELEQLQTRVKTTEISKEEKIDHLAAILQLLADVWPNERDNVAKAGAQFEEIFESLIKDSIQIKKLADLTWEGLKYLYEKDDYFITVKNSTMRAVNTFREYILSDGDVKVDDFETIYDELENALNGNGESADSVIELTSEEIETYQKEENQVKESGKKLGEGLLPAETTLNDLASYIMMLDEESVTNDQIERLAAFLQNSINNESEAVAKHLTEAFQLVSEAYNNSNNQDGWLSIVSVKIEAATVQEQNQEWEASQEETEEVEETAEVQKVDEPESASSENETKVEESVSEELPPSIEEKDAFHIPVDIDVTLVAEFITECNELIEAAEGALLDLEDRPEDNELVNTVFRAYHTIKGTSAFMGLEPVTEFTHFVETVLSIVRDGDLPFDRACADINFESIDIIKKLLESVENLQAGDFLPMPDNYSSLLGVLIDVSENKIAPAEALAKRKGNPLTKTTDEKASINEPLVDAPAKESIKEQVKPTNTESETTNESASQTQKNESESSVRVSVNRLDRLIDMVGELVIAHSVVAQDQNIPNDSELQKKVNHATKILRELQDTSLTLRMVPLRATFHKMNRLVRDLSRKAGKPVKFSTTGEDTEIDRNMVDIINEPLIHMLRNSLDHGIETPDQRGKTGKSEVANIVLKAFQEGGKVVIQIIDDGRGIDKDIILKKAIEKGIVDPDKKMTESEIFGLIFLPGFSSAEKVTDLSGRGVGMDVVRRSIEQLQGKVEVTSELGVGTTITIELPFTLAITDGMLVRVGQERFIVPTINIDMTFRANPEDLFTILGESEQVSFRGKSVPVIRLHSLFDIENAQADILNGTMLVIKNNNNRYALLVDEVIGQQQLVGKSINMINTTKHISGGAILGDGRVGLILDTSALMA